MKDQDVYANKPKVSVIIPTYNCGLYIGEAIRSVFGQTYANHETIVVDDGSTDDTQAMLAPYRERITYLYQENQGVVAARNLGIRQARGEVIAFLDSDDVWNPTKLLLQIEAFAQYTKAGFSFTNYLEFDEAGVIKQSRFDERVHRWLDENGDGGTELVCGWIYRELLQGNYMHTSSVLVKSDVLEEVGLFDESFKVCQDHDLWLRIAQKFRVVCVNRVVCGYRYRREGLSGSAESRIFRWNKDSLRVLEKHLRNDSIPRELRSFVKGVMSRLCWSVGWTYFSWNRFKEARRLLIKGIRYRPLRGWYWIFWGTSFLPVRAIEKIRFIKRRLSVFEGVAPVGNVRPTNSSHPEGR
ncbi:MAG: glycosyltransferase [Verrucomicrobia bacterium]|nr:glycosyltransferase [Verrucomicrobiota bacterium]